MLRSTCLASVGRLCGRRAWRVGVALLVFVLAAAAQAREVRVGVYGNPPKLFQGPQVTTNLDLDIHTGVSASYVRESRGNPDLKPEIGSMVVGGVVYSPSWLPGFTASVDGYSLYITDAIGATNQGNLNRQCEDSGGTDPVCQYIIRPGPFSDRYGRRGPLIVGTSVLGICTIASAFAADLPTIQRMVQDAKDRDWSDQSFAARGIETAEQWWDALGREPSMAPLIAERTRRLAAKERPASSPSFDQHVETLRDAGFREVAPVWQSGTDRVLLAVR